VVFKKKSKNQKKKKSKQNPKQYKTTLSFQN